jgi:hypothetical protein
MPYEIVLSSADRVVCKICKVEGAGFTMTRQSAWYHDKVFHPELAEPESQPPVLEEAATT